MHLVFWTNHLRPSKPQSKIHLCERHALTLCGITIPHREFVVTTAYMELEEGFQLERRCKHCMRITGN